MRVVFDTNVLVSALIKPGSLPDLALSMARHGTAQCIISSPITDELRHVLLEKLELEPSAVESFLKILSGHCETVFPRKTLHIIKEDPSDDRILECAVEGKADVIVTGDRHLLALKNFRKIPILTVREFVDIIHHS